MGLVTLPVPRDNVYDLLPQAEGFLKGALARPGHNWTWEKLVHDLERGFLVLWLTVRVGGESPEPVAATTTRVLSDVVEIVHHGGSTDAWATQLPVIEGYAHQVGRGRVRICGRQGWKRALEGQGYKLVYVALEKSLTLEDDK